MARTGTVCVFTRHLVWLSANPDLALANALEVLGYKAYYVRDIFRYYPDIAWLSEEYDARLRVEADTYDSEKFDQIYGHHEVNSKDSRFPITTFWLKWIRSR